MPRKSMPSSKRRFASTRSSTSGCIAVSRPGRREKQGFTTGNLTLCRAYVILKDTEGVTAPQDGASRTKEVRYARQCNALLDYRHYRRGARFYRHRRCGDHYRPNSVFPVCRVVHHLVDHRSEKAVARRFLPERGFCLNETRLNERGLASARPLVIAALPLRANVQAYQASMRLYFRRCGVSLPTRLRWSASYSV